MCKFAMLEIFLEMDGTRLVCDFVFTERVVIQIFNPRIYSNFNRNDRTTVDTLPSGNNLKTESIS